jgi:hypothetical protein
MYPCQGSARHYSCSMSFLRAVSYLVLFTVANCSRRWWSPKAKVIQRINHCEEVMRDRYEMLEEAIQSV